jgi:hypothetical protein
VIGAAAAGRPAASTAALMNKAQMKDFRVCMESFRAEMMHNMHRGNTSVKIYSRRIANYKTVVTAL